MMDAQIKNEKSTHVNFMFAPIVKDQQGIVVSDTSIVGQINPNESITPSISWTPKFSGKYTVSFELWDSKENKKIIKINLETKIIFHGNFLDPYKSYLIFL